LNPSRNRHKRPAKLYFQYLSCFDEQHVIFDEHTYSNDQTRFLLCKKIINLVFFFSFQCAKIIPEILEADKIFRIFWLLA